MMGDSLKNCNFKELYRIPHDDIESSFIVPSLKCAESYDRATGFFSSWSLLRSSIGLCSLAKNGGHIRILTSPRLTKEDLEAICEGYSLKEAVEDTIIRDFEEEGLDQYRDRLSLLTHLISRGILEFKVCVMKNSNNGLFHPKFGIISDYEGNSVYFDGSMNESLNGQLHNWESIVVINSWDKQNVIDEQKDAFNSLWNGTDPFVETYEITPTIRRLISEYSTVPEEVCLQLDDLFIKSSLPSKYFIKPSNISLYDYQKEAINSWEKAKFRGIYNMATGTGKTITALSSLEVLCNKMKYGGIVVIVCPLLHLVEQWASQIRKYGVNPIICHSKSPEKNWLDTVLTEIDLVDSKTVNSRGFYHYSCIVTTNNTFRSKKMKDALSSVKSKKILVVDEVHNMGSMQSLQALSNDFDYRLGLSATFIRYNDPEGTKKLEGYFGGICIEYGLEDAIRDKHLTEYYYHPILCTMNSAEYSCFVDLNQEIQTILKVEPNKSKRERLIRDVKMAGARLISGLDSKFDNLLNLIGSKYTRDNLMLVYCGCGKIRSEEEPDETSDDEIRIIEKMSLMIGETLDMRIGRITCEESLDVRKLSIRDFENKQLQALIAIKCLDEGVDIPSVRTAFITSSGTDPKEYIQRRGRVLRKAPGKTHATIYDFITLPRDLSSVGCSSSIMNDFDLIFLSKEFKRMHEFASLSSNPSETMDYFNEITAAYGIDLESVLNDSREGIQ